MKLLLVAFTVFYIGCTGKSQNANRRDIYMGFSLGSGSTEVNRLFQKYLSEKKLLRYNNIAYSQDKTIKGKEYYSSPIFIIPKTDSLLSEIRIVYSDVLNDYFDYLSMAASAGNEYYIQLADSKEISSDEIARDVIKKVTTNYKQYDATDTIFTDGVTSKTYYWNNRKDVDIILKHNTELRFDRVNDKVIHYYFILLTYKYSEKLREKVFEKKSIY